MCVWERSHLAYAIRDMELFVSLSGFSLFHFPSEHIKYIDTFRYTVGNLHKLMLFYIVHNFQFYTTPFFLFPYNRSNRNNFVCAQNERSLELPTLNQCSFSLCPASKKWTPAKSNLPDVALRLRFRGGPDKLTKFNKKDTHVKESEQKTMCLHIKNNKDTLQVYILYDIYILVHTIYKLVYIIYKTVLLAKLTCCIPWRQSHKNPRRAAPVWCRHPICQMVNHPACRKETTNKQHGKHGHEKDMDEKR